jgi:D-alanyl-D-alanine carboxypeptidase (penicillin-binding protein 5/6)
MFAAPATAQTVPSTTAPPPTATAEILVDADTGRVLVEHDAHEALPPGSLTKTLMAMIAADWLPSAASVPVPIEAYNAFPDKVGMKPGQRWPLGTTLHALITDSANDAAYALAVDIGGSLQGFAPVMQEAAGQIGMTDHPVLQDPAGLDGTEGVNGGNRISAWDLAIAGRDMMANPTLAAIAGQHTFDFEGPDGIAYHLVSRNYHFLAGYPGAIGIKTGYTVAAGYCDMEEAVQGGRKMIAVVLHSTNPDADAGSLITQGFATPVARESHDPQLPAVTEPKPVRFTPSLKASGAATPTPTEPTAVVAGAATRPGPDWQEGVALAGVAVGGVMWLRRMASSPRKRPGGGRNRR